MKLSILPATIATDLPEIISRSGYGGAADVSVDALLLNAYAHHRTPVMDPCREINSLPDLPPGADEYPPEESGHLVLMAAAGLKTGKKRKIMRNALTVNRNASYQ